MASATDQAFEGTTEINIKTTLTNANRIASLIDQLPAALTRIAQIERTLSENSNLLAETAKSLEDTLKLQNSSIEILRTNIEAKFSEFNTATTTTNRDIQEIKDLLHAREPRPTEPITPTSATEPRRSGAPYGFEPQGPTPHSAPPFERPPPRSPLHLIVAAAAVGALLLTSYIAKVLAGV